MNKGFQHIPPEVPLEASSSTNPEAVTFLRNVTVTIPPQHTTVVKQTLLLSSITRRFSLALCSWGKVTSQGKSSRHSVIHPPSLHSGHYQRLYQSNKYELIMKYGVTPFMKSTVLRLSGLFCRTLESTVVHRCYFNTVQLSILPVSRSRHALLTGN